MRSIEHLLAGVPGPDDERDGHPRQVDHRVVEPVALRRGDVVELDADARASAGPGAVQAVVVWWVVHASSGVTPAYFCLNRRRFVIDQVT